jgi:hypothetical protein
MVSAPPKAPAGTPPSPGIAPTVAVGNPPPKLPAVVDGNGGASKPALFGGHRGGKKTLSGFPVGSPQHREWQLKRDRDRKARAAAAAAPAALPAKPVTGSAPVLSSPGTPAPGAILPPGSPVVALPLGENLEQPVAWDAKELREFIGEVAPMIEELLIRAKLRKLERANIPPELAAQIVKDAESGWPKKARAMLEKSLSTLSAKYLNESGISPELQPAIGLVAGVGIIAASEVSFHKRMDKVIKAGNAPIDLNKPQPEKTP